MSEMADRATLPVQESDDQVSAIQRVLRESREPMTVSKIRSALPQQFRSEPEELTEVLRRQVTANVLMQFPRYRSQQERFWDRPMGVHVADMIRAALAENALNFSELRRKLPGYAQERAEAVLSELLARGELHRHPRQGRGSERYGLQPAKAADYLRPELASLFSRLLPLGFTREQLRAAALELLHDEEWS